MSAVLAAILARRSIAPRRLIAPGPDEAGLMRLAEAVAAAPDHGGLGPARLLHLQDRAALADLFVQAERDAAPDADAARLDRAREKALAGPVLLAFVVRIRADHPVAPAPEQWLSAGAALQNLLLAAEALGFRAMIVSGDRVRAAALRAGLGLAPDEHLAGFVAIGSEAEPPRPVHRRAPGDVLAPWPGPAD